MHRELRAAVTVVEFAIGIADADHRTLQIFIIKAHRFGKGAMGKAGDERFAKKASLRLVAVGLLDCSAMICPLV